MKNCMNYRFIGQNVVSNNSPKLVNVAAILRIKFLKIEYIHQAL